MSVRSIAREREVDSAGVAASSLIPETLQAMSSDEEYVATAARLAARGQAALTREERRKRQRSLDASNAPSFQSVLAVST